MSYRRSSLHPRASVFTARQSILESSAGPSPYLPTLEATVEFAKECNTMLQSTVETSRKGTYDLRRLTKVLESTRLFILVDEQQVRQFKNQLSEEIEPQITELISLAEKSLKTLERKENNLKSKIEMADKRHAVKPSAPLTMAARNEARKVKLLISQQERLAKELETIEAEVKALERQRSNSVER